MPGRARESAAAGGAQKGAAISNKKYVGRQGGCKGGCPADYFAGAKRERNMGGKSMAERGERGDRSRVRACIGVGEESGKRRSKLGPRPRVGRRLFGQGAIET